MRVFVPTLRLLAALGRRFASPGGRNPSERERFLLVLLRGAVVVGGVIMSQVRQSIVEVRPLLSEQQCAEMVDWAERQGLAAWPTDAEMPALSRRVADERLLEGIWPRLAEAIRLALRREPVRFVGPAFIDRFDAGQRLPPVAGGGVECGPEESKTALGVVVFLNDAFAGGEFIGYPFDAPVAAAPAAGAALVFPAFLTCEDAPVREGRKYVLRAAVALAEE